jgi:hypothetical protein
MIMAQIVIDVDGVPVLFSPVLAHALEPGDLIHQDGHAWRVLAPPTEFNPDRRPNAPSRSIQLRRVADGEWVHGGFSANAPVLRAVGARAGRGGAR